MPGWIPLEPDPGIVSMVSSEATPESGMIIWLSSVLACFHRLTLHLGELVRGGYSFLFLFICIGITLQYIVPICRSKDHRGSVRLDPESNFRLVFY